MMAHFQNKKIDFNDLNLQFYFLYGRFENRVLLCFENRALMFFSQIHQ